MTNLLQFLLIAPTDQNTIEQALNLDIKDFKHAVQMVAAIQCKADCLVTRNTKDFKPSLLPAMQPVDYLTSISNLFK
jgi:hypothetical protein